MKEQQQGGGRGRGGIPERQGYVLRMWCGRLTEEDIQSKDVRVKRLWLYWDWMIII